MWQALADEDGVEAFEVGEDDELLQRGVIPHIALGGGIGIPPLFGGLAEEGDVQQIRLAGIDSASLCLGDGRRDEGVLDGVGVDAVYCRASRLSRIKICGNEFFPLMLLCPIMLGSSND